MHSQQGNAEDIAAYQAQCLKLCTVKPIPDDLFSNTILNPAVIKHYIQHEIMNVNFIPQLHKNTRPTLYLTNTISPAHDINVARETAKAMINCPLEFHEIENCGLVMIDAKEQGLALIKDFVEKISAQ